MLENFLTFQKFNDIASANDLADHLNQAGIESIIEDNSKLFDPNFAFNSVEPAISLKIRQEDFPQAHKALEEYYRLQLVDVDPNYYLFEFTNLELMEIIWKPDEWGAFDYQLAQKILKDRGKEVTPQHAEQLKSQRNLELAKPETNNLLWITLGYISAFFGGFFGLIIGWTIGYLKKTLPDGQRVYVYKESDRWHGKCIFLISIVSMIAWIFINPWQIIPPSYGIF